MIVGFRLNTVGEGLALPGSTRLYFVFARANAKNKRFTAGRGKSLPYSDISRRSDVQVHDIFCVLLDPLAPRFDLFAHEDGEDLIGLDGVV